MPRGKRLNVIGGVYHLFIRGIERKEIFKDDRDREEFLVFPIPWYPRILPKEKR
ncbi:MAG: hypothetical protein KKF54_07900 [Candidatus Omnitrophica bacterium]|nr:hypothetical protein [Candidatus Omnitrophota bacterium]